MRHLNESASIVQSSVFNSLVQINLHTTSQQTEIKYRLPDKTSSGGDEFDPLQDNGALNFGQLKAFLRTVKVYLDLAIGSSL